MELMVADRTVDWLDLQHFLRSQLKPYGSEGGQLLKTYDTHRRRLVEIVKRSSVMGESNSVLIIGCRGCGKSVLLKSAIAELYENSFIKDNLMHVYLNGLIHTNDSIALNAIISQLNLEGVGDPVVGSFSKKLTFLLDALKSGSKQSKSIIFVLDEFDLFCNHKDQTLLYNLFDVAQSQHSPICVIGLSCQPDILCKLENRVKSRFSHQQIYLYGNNELSDYMTFAQEILCLPQDFKNKKFMKEWNGHIGKLMEHTAVKEVLKKNFERSGNLRDLKKLLLHSVTMIGPLHPRIVPDDLVDAFAFFSKDLKSTMIQGLSVLEVSLIIAMMHLTELYDGEPFNLEMVYHEYKKFLQKQMSLQNVDKAVVMKAYEHLLALELVKEITPSNAKNLKRFVPLRLLLEPSQIKEALKGYPNLPSQLQNWSSSIIVE